MSEGALPIGPARLALAAALVLVAGVVSLALRLSLEKKLLVASLRTVVQLLLVGLVLGWVFEAESPLVLAGALLIMVVAAARAAVRRSSRRYRGATLGAFVTLSLSGVSTAFVVTTFIVGVEPWYHARYVLPLLGMILGNSLTGISLCLDSLLATLDDRREEIELSLSLGATRWEAARGPIAEAVRRGMIPIINAMTVVGIVSLPGMMTGQILAGASPMRAVEYQIVVMFMLAASTALGAIGVALFTFRRLFNERHQLRSEQILSRG